MNYASSQRCVPIVAWILETLDVSVKEGTHQGLRETLAHSVGGFVSTSQTIEALSALLQFALTLPLSGSQRQ